MDFSLRANRLLRAPAVCGLVLMSATAVLYLPHVHRAAFVYEDLNDANTLYREDGWRQDLHDLRTRPARWLTGVTYRLAGPYPRGQHLVNLVVHLLNGLLLAAVVRRYASAWAAVVAAGAFWLHPVAAEAVAYSSARGDLLLTSFLLVGLWACAAERPWLAWLSAAGAVLAKESGVAVWLALPVAGWAAWPARWRWVWAATCLVPVAAALSALPPGAYPVPTALSVGTSVAQFAAVSTWVAWPVGLTILPAWGWLTPQVARTALLLAAIAVIWILALRTYAAARVAAVVGLLALPRLVVPLAEGWHAHHLYAPLAVLLGSAAAWLFPKESVE